MLDFALCTVTAFLILPVTFPHFVGYILRGPSPRWFGTIMMWWSTMARRHRLHLKLRLLFCWCLQVDNLNSYLAFSQSPSSSCARFYLWLSPRLPSRRMEAFESRHRTSSYDHLISRLFPSQCIAPPAMGILSLCCDHHLFANSSFFLDILFASPSQHRH